MVSFLLVLGACLTGPSMLLAWDSTYLSPNETETTLWRESRRCLWLALGTVVVLAVGGSLLALVGIVLGINNLVWKARLYGTSAKPRGGGGGGGANKKLRRPDRACLVPLFGRLCQVVFFSLYAGPLPPRQGLSRPGELSHSALSAPRGVCGDRVVPVPAAYYLED